MSTANNAETAGKSPRRIVISLSIPALVALVIVMALGFSWAFWLGLRTAQEQDGADAEFMAQSPVNPAFPEEDAGSAAETGAMELIQEEDLNFKENLERDNEMPEEFRPSAVSASAEAPLPGRTARGAQVAAEQGRTLPDNSSAIFSYQYQIASYSKTEQAEELAAKLLTKGITAHTENALIQGQPRYRVVIAFQGDESSVNLMKQRLKQDFGIESILQRNKKAISR